MKRKNPQQFYTAKKKNKDDAERKKSSNQIDVSPHKSKKK